MASSPESSPSGQANNNSNSTSSPPSNSPSPPSPSSSQSPPPKAPPPSPSAPKSPPPSQSPPPSPPASPPPKSPPAPSQKSPPPSSSSPPPSSPSPPPSSPTPSSPPPSKDNNSPPPPASSKTSPPPSSGDEAASPPPSSSSSSPSTPNATHAPSTSDGTPSTIFSPPPAINARPGAPSLTSPPPSSPGFSDSSGDSSNHTAIIAATATGGAQEESGDSSNHAAIIAAAATGGALVLVVVVVALLCILRTRRRNVYIDPARRQHAGGGNVEHVVKLSPPPGVTVSPRSGWGPLHSSPSSNTNSPGFSDPHQLPHIGKFQFTYDELAAATGGFSRAKILGQGGFGYVYRGMLPNGQEVAVKTLKTGSGQGDREFQAEVEIISRVHHRHLVSLVGYSMIKEQRMLVYEFVSNGTLEFHLYGKGQPVMDWKSRLRIAVGSAKGLAYLHEDCHPKIIHRDIKAANILIDNNFEAMVADFGLAKFTSDDITHVSTRVMGTFGYMAPEYASTGKLTDKSDVFSFGVMLLEIITGRRPIDPTNNLMEDSLVDWARPLIAKALENGNYDELVDPRLEGNYDPQDMARMVSTAYSSIRYSAKMRPKMSQNVRTLKGDFDDQRTIPGHSFGETDVYDTTAYNADMLKFKQMVMNSQEFQSSEFGDATNEYGRLSVYSDKDYNSINNSHNV